MSSFRKRTQETKAIPGTRSSLYNGQTIASTGNPSLDHILGGGVQIGSLLLIEEDPHVVYSKVLAKYFLAEGVVSKQSLFFGSLDDEPEDLLKKLPKPVEEDSNTSSETSPDMRIAWRYNDLPQVNSEQGGQKIGHHFNILEQMSSEDLKESDISTWSKGSFSELIKKLAQKVKTVKEDSVLRICLTSLGSPLWYSENLEFSKDILKFLTILRAILRTYNTIAFVTIPMGLLEKIDEKLVPRIRNLADYSIQLDSFAGTDRETVPAFKEYNGILNIRKLSALNTLTAFNPETTDLAFKLRRKKFVIEKFHLPPELQDAENPQDDIVPSLSCGGSGKKSLDF
ncbi:ELP4 family protein [Megaselia abdita]